MLNEHLNELSKIFSRVTPLYIVGGFVRDKLLNKTSLDVDLASKLTLDEVDALLKGTNFKLEVNNKTFGTAKIKTDEVCFEYSTFRKDIYLEKKKAKHSPSKVTFVSTIEEDCLRRDFTINAIYYNLQTNTYVDETGGIKDLNNKLLKMVTPTTLNYDGERLLRLARFKVELGFRVEEETLRSAKLNAKNVLELSSNTIQKFLRGTYKYNLKQKQELKEFLNLINLNEISNLIK